MSRSKGCLWPHDSSFPDSLFFFLGSTVPRADASKAPPNHSSKFKINEASLAAGARAMTALALGYLRLP